MIEYDFENVNYTYYSDTMGRAVIPSEDDFNSLKDEELLKAKTLLPYITDEREENGLQKAVCMMIEESYKANKNKTADGRIETSHSLDGFSQSFDLSNAKSIDELKKKWLNLYCYLDFGVL